MSSGNITDYQANAALNAIFGSGAPATLYLGILTDTNTPTQRNGGTYTEPSGNNYSRVAVTNNTTNFPAAASRVKTTGADVNFPTPSGSWGTAQALGVFDASTAGHLLWWMPITGTPVINSGQPVSFLTGSVQALLS